MRKLKGTIESTGETIDAYIDDDGGILVSESDYRKMMSHVPTQSTEVDSFSFSATIEVKAFPHD